MREDPDLANEETLGYGEFIKGRLRAGVRVGRYELVDELGKGGFGVVYRAKQHEPVEREVALKIIRPGMGSREISARFEAERQVLAMMDHPGIAQIFDAGTTETELPYFVMELVGGLPVNRFCDVNNLPLHGRLRLFIAVCEAVQHAHQKGIIHRDLKPSNILISDDGRPKVIDFGIAKALDQELAEQTLTTDGQLIGSPLYMSPEQVSEGALNVDIRIDVYALGVVLYELLTGTTPLESDTVRGAGMLDLPRLIREYEPPPPSSRVGTLQEQRARDTAGNRGQSVGRLNSALRGDLDWVVMKALEKERDRRYATANELAADLKRYLGDEPVLARPPSASYRLGKFARRNKGLLTSIALVTVALVSGVVVSLSQAVRASRAEGLAVKRLGEVDRERAAAVEQKVAAEQARDEAETVAQFLQDAFEGGPSDGNSVDPAVTILESLDRAARNLETGFKDRPATRARLGFIVARLYWSMGIDKGEEVARRELDCAARDLGPDHEATLRLDLQVTQRMYEDQAKMIRRFDSILERARRTLGRDHVVTAKATEEVARMRILEGKVEESKALYDEAIEIYGRHFGEESYEATMAWVTSTHNYLATEPEEAKRILNEARERAKRHQPKDGRFGMVDIFATGLLGVALHQEGKVEEGQTLTQSLQAKNYRRIVAAYRRIHGGRDDRTLKAMEDLAIWSQDTGDAAAVEKIWLEILGPDFKSGFPLNHYQENALRNLEYLYKMQGRPEKAAALSQPEKKAP